MRSFHARSAGRRAAARRGGFTLVEILTATLLALVMMAIVTEMFGRVAEAVNQNRASIEMRGQLRGVTHRLQKDLEGITARTTAPLNPDENLGYLEIIEGPIGPIYWPCDPTQTVLANGSPVLFDGSGKPNPAYDTTLGDRDDVIMFTSRSRTEPFRGTSATRGTIESNEAEICWFLRGTTLYRRVLLVGTTDPRFRATELGTGSVPTSADGSYNGWDLSVREVGVTTNNPRFNDPTADGSGYNFMPNTLGDLTKRENRYAHPPTPGSVSTGYPFDARLWGDLGLPTLGESSGTDWPLPALSLNCNTGGNVMNTPTLTSGSLSVNTSGSYSEFGLTNNGSAFDARRNRFPWNQVDASNGQLLLTNGRPRGAEDVVLTNVLKFDVKVWDPGAPTYVNDAGNMVLPGDPGYLSLVGVDTPVGYGAWVDLNYMCLEGGSGSDPTYSGPASLPASFHGPGNPRSQLNGQAPSGAVAPFTARPSVYDTGSTHYEGNGVDEDNDGLADEGSNGFDDDGINGIDDAGEKEAPPPYSAPLRGVQITISVFEPDTQEIREVSVVQDFIRE